MRKEAEHCVRSNLTAKSAPSRRVSSETGVAIDAMIADELPETPYQRAVNEIFAILHRLPPSMRRAALVYVAAQIEKEAENDRGAEAENRDVQTR